MSRTASILNERIITNALFERRNHLAEKSPMRPFDLGQPKSDVRPFYAQAAFLDPSRLPIANPASMSALAIWRQMQRLRAHGKGASRTESFLP
jgi:hypothetical protein